MFAISQVLPACEFIEVASFFVEPVGGVASANMLIQYTQSSTVTLLASVSAHVQEAVFSVGRIDPVGELLEIRFEKAVVGALVLNGVGLNDIR